MRLIRLYTFSDKRDSGSNLILHNWTAGDPIGRPYSFDVYRLFG